MISSIFNYYYLNDPPGDPVDGQIWMDCNNVMKVFSRNSWADVNPFWDDRKVEELVEFCSTAEVEVDFTELFNSVFKGKL